MLLLVYIIYKLGKGKAYNTHLVLDLLSSYKTHSAVVESAYIFKSRTRINLTALHHI